jgi:hypothetical protein
MITVDNILLKIVNFAGPTIEEIMPSRDSRVLRSLATAVNTHYFITESQSKLLLKILKEHREKISINCEELTYVLELPTWSKTFRKVEQVKKLFLSKNSSDDLVLFVEFTFSANIRKIIQNNIKHIENLIQIAPGKTYQADLSEKNIVVLIELLSPLEFEIDELLKKHYETIKSWEKTTFSDQFLIGNMPGNNFQKTITDDLGLSTTIDKNIINDRSVRYQYFAEKPEKSGNSLVEYIANRSQPRLWIDSTIHTVDTVIASLISLKRFPLLVVFPNWLPQKLQENMVILSDSLENNNIADSVGIYFRMDNDPQGKLFNQLIAEKKYNIQLDSATQVVGIQTGKLPKFLIKNDWTPMSVISFDANLRYNKASLYTNCCDLVITYSEAPTIIEHRLK